MANVPIFDEVPLNFSEAEKPWTLIFKQLWGNKESFIDIVSRSGDFLEQAESTDAIKKIMASRAMEESEERATHFPFHYVKVTREELKAMERDAK